MSRTWPDSMSTSVRAVDLLLIRHATTDWNLAGRLNAAKEVPLNDRGIREAAAVARHIRSHGHSASIWASPAARAQVTAAAIATAMGTAFRTETNAREVDFGRFEGQTRTNLLDGVERARFLEWEGGLPVDGVESLESAGERARTVFDQLLADRGSVRQVLVSHGVFIRVFICVNALYISPTAYRRLVVENASLSVLQVRFDGVRLARLNATHHLALDDRAEW